MKKFLSCLLVVLMVSALFAISAGAIVSDEHKNYGEVAIVPGASMRVDAVKEDAYNQATPIEIKYVHANEANPKTASTNARYNGAMGGDPVPEGIATGTAYIVYNGDYLWIYVDVVDKSLVTKAPNALESSFRQDSVEFMMDWTNQAAMRDTCILQARMTHEGYISGREDGPNGTSLFGSIDDGGPNPVTWLTGDAKHTDTGWACEFRIQVPADFDQEYFSISLLINDYDENETSGGTGSRVMVTSDDVNGAGQWAGNFYGYVKFDYLNYQPDTGDMAVVYIALAMVLALGLGAVTVVSMKKRAQ